ncbi:hypothetical protein Tco_1291087, partial [Tanacetum coccineum]
VVIENLTYLLEKIIRDGEFAKEMCKQIKLLGKDVNEDHDEYEEYTCYPHYDSYDLIRMEKIMRSIIKLKSIKKPNEEIMASLRRIEEHTCNIIDMLSVIPEERSVVEDVKMVEICVGSNMEEIRDIELKDVEKLERRLKVVMEEAPSKRKKNEVKSKSSLVEEANPQDHVKSITTQSGDIFYSLFIPVTDNIASVSKHVAKKMDYVKEPTSYSSFIFLSNGISVFHVVKQIARKGRRARESVDQDKKFLSSLKKLQGQHPCCGLQSTPKEKDPGSFTLLFIIGNLSFSNVLAELEASVSLRPFPTYAKLSLCELALTCLSIKLADKLVKRPRGIVKNILVKIDKFVFPVDFVIIDMPEDTKAPIILGSPFLATARAKIDVFSRRISSKIGVDKIVFDCDKSVDFTFASICCIKIVDAPVCDCMQDDKRRNLTFSKSLKTCSLMKFQGLGIFLHVLCTYARKSNITNIHNR